MSFPGYENYRNSGVEWLGEIPEGWLHSSLRHVCDRITDGSHFSPASVASGLPYVTVRDIEDSKVNLPGSARISEVDFQLLVAAGCRPSVGDVLFSKDGTVGKVAIVEDNEFVALSSLAIITPKEGRLSPRFFLYFMQSGQGLDQVKSLYVGAALKRITLDAIHGIQIPLPSIDEQLRIEKFLDHATDKIDELMKQQCKLIELLKEKRQAVISHAVTKGLHPHASMKDSGIEWLGHVPAKWQVVRLGAIFREVNEEGIEGLPILSVSIHHGVSDKQLDDDELDRKVTRSDDQTKYKIVAPGDLVYNMMRAWQGGFGTVTVEGMVSPAYVVARPTKAFSSLFVEMLLRTPCAVEEMRRYSQGVTDFRLRLYWDNFKSIRIALPSPAEQEKILAFIKTKTFEFNRLTAAAQKAITLLQERRTALISAAVTGKIDVRKLSNRSGEGSENLTKQHLKTGVFAAAG